MVDHKTSHGSVGVSKNTSSNPMVLLKVAYDGPDGFDEYESVRLPMTPEEAIFLAGMLIKEANEIKNKDSK